MNKYDSVEGDISEKAESEIEISSSKRRNKTALRLNFGGTKVDRNHFEVSWDDGRLIYEK